MPTFTIKRMAEGAWMPAVGNVATVMCFSICLILNVNLLILIGINLTAT